MDAVEQLRLANGQQVSWLRWVDEFTGAVLGTVVFPPHDFPRSAHRPRPARHAPALAALGALRVDNGLPWGNWNDLPTFFALWLAGLSIRLLFNDPCCPQQNPKVERSQGTGKRWAEPGSCHSVKELQANLNQADRDQREYYPAAAGSRMELFPSLQHSGQHYDLSWEKRTWSLRAAEHYLAEFVAIRKVSGSGHIRVYYANQYIGVQFKGEYVQVQYDPDRNQWIVSDKEGREVRRLPAAEINHENLVKATCPKNRKKL